MCSADHLNIITKRMVQEYREIFGGNLKKVYLYGSYARGDYNEDSDIDIVGIVDYDENDLSKADRRLSYTASRLGLEYDILVSPSTIPYERFKQYQKVLPYYSNILKDGVDLIDG